MLSILVGVEFQREIESVSCPLARKTNSKPTSVQVSGVLGKACPRVEGPVG